MDTDTMYMADGTAAAIMPEYWPVNAIVMQQLIYSGLRNLEIASLYNVPLPAVLQLRRQYDL